MRRILPRCKIIKTSPYPWICALQLHVNVGMCMCLEYCEDHWEIFLSNLVRVENIRNCIYFILFYWFSSGTLHTNQHSKCK